MKLRAVFVFAVLPIIAAVVGCSPSPTPGPSPTTTTPVTTTTGPSHLAVLQGTGAFTVDFSALVTFRSGQSETTLPAVFFVHGVPIAWSGTAFAGHLEEQGAGEDITDTVQGSVSADGNTLVSLVYSRRVIRTAYSNGTAYTVTLKDVPLASASRVGAFQGNGADLQRYVAGVQYLDGQVSGGQIISNFEYVGTDWTAGGAQSPTLKLSFDG